MSAITLSQALLNHLGIRVTTRLTDFSGYWILFVSVALTATLIAFAPGCDWTRLVRFENFSGLPSGQAVWPRTENLAWLFALGFLLPAYTIWNATVGYEIKALKTSVFLAAKNLLDELYVVDRSRGLLPGPTRLFQVGLVTRLP